MNKKNKGGGSNLGRTLIKDRFSNTSKRKVDSTMLHTAEIQDGYDWGRLNLCSVTEESSFQEFLRTAELAGTEFQAEKLNISFVSAKQTIGLLSNEEQKRIEQKHEDNKEMLKIPRRPKWNADMTAEDLQRAENDSFLEWRRSLSAFQENNDILMTPYERNLEFWRQLWRVVERSDVVVQIVDARNPLLFRSVDLEKYVHEIGTNKMNMILVNKADFLTEQQRQHWAKYFDSEGIRTAFFSATLALKEANVKAAAAADDDGDDDDDGRKDSTPLTSQQCLAVQAIQEATKNISDTINDLDQKLTLIEHIISPPSRKRVEKNSSKILNRMELIEFFRNVYAGQPMTTIGLVGYPNVGKSSTINALLTEKKVSVSDTPGKTKHFQTLYLTNELMLCDCPGLVMPSFVQTKADMILNGILPIDQMHDHAATVNLLSSRIPRHILEDKYGIIIARPQEGEDPDRSPYGDEVLLAHGYNRGFMTARGQPDQARSARYLCKDYVNGKLLYCIAPPDVHQEDYHQFPPKVRKSIAEESLPGQQQRSMRVIKARTSHEVDTQFFAANNSHVHIKGRSDFPNIVGMKAVAPTSSASNSEKPWRKVKKEKREKLRKKFRHLDLH